MEHEKLLNAFSFVKMQMYFMLETLAAARFWNVDPFDQPAVEEGKILAIEYLNRAG